MHQYTQLHLPRKSIAELYSLYLHSICWRHRRCKVFANRHHCSLLDMYRSRRCQHSTMKIRIKMKKVSKFYIIWAILINIYWIYWIYVSVKLTEHLGVLASDWRVAFLEMSAVIVLTQNAVVPVHALASPHPHTPVDLQKLASSPVQVLPATVHYKKSYYHINQYW